MAVQNMSPWRGTYSGRNHPIRQRLLVAAGSSQTIKKGEICLFDVASADLDPVDAVADNLHGFAIADEEQKAGDPARFMWFIIPRANDDIFEFPLNTPTAVKFGDELAFHSTDSSQTLAVSGTDPIGSAVEVNTPDTGVTWPTVSMVKMVFKAVAAGGLDLPLIGSNLGDGS